MRDSISAKAAMSAFCASSRILPPPATGYRLGWARMYCEGGALMFLCPEESHPQRKCEVLFAMYTPDMPAIRNHLLANGLEASPIKYPEYVPSRTLEIADPDGYILGVHHWSDKKHERWENERKTRLIKP
jgi:hypothetical protein